MRLSRVSVLCLAVGLCLAGPALAGPFGRGKARSSRVNAPTSETAAQGRAPERVRSGRGRGQGRAGKRSRLRTLRFGSLRSARAPHPEIEHTGARPMSRRLRFAAAAADRLGGAADATANHLRRIGDHLAERRIAGRRLLRPVGRSLRGLGNGLELFLGRETLRSMSCEVAVGCGITLIPAMRKFGLNLDSKVLKYKLPGVGVPLENFLSVGVTFAAWSGSVDYWERVANGAGDRDHNFFWTAGAGTLIGGLDYSPFGGLSKGIAFAGLKGYVNDRSYGLTFGVNNVLSLGVGEAGAQNQRQYARGPYAGLSVGHPTFVPFVNLGAGGTVFYRPLGLMTRHVRKPAARLQSGSRKVQDAIDRTARRAGGAVARPIRRLTRRARERRRQRSAPAGTASADSDAASE